MNAATRFAAGPAAAIGSRPIAGAKLEVRQPFLREMAGRAFNKVVQLLGVRGIDDTQCGFKMFTRVAAQDVFKRTKLTGYGFDFESLMIARDLGYKIAEVPIRWAHQEGSKVNPIRDGSRMVAELIKLRIQGKKARIKPRED